MCRFNSFSPGQKAIHVGITRGFHESPRFPPLSLSMREESRSWADKIELGDELVKILPDSFVEMSQGGTTCKFAPKQFLYL